jgi:phage/plasmid-like protein (TIGR03299 family)
MADNIDTSNSRYNIAFLGSRDNIWHRHGQQQKPGQTIKEWADAAGLAFTAILVPITADLSGADFAHLPPELRNAVIHNRKAIVRNDTGAPLGIGSDIYRIHQPAEVLEFFGRQIEVDDRFQLDVAGSLDGGRKIWATAKFNGDVSVAGDKHLARVLMSTTFDGSGSSKNKMSLTRVVCDNTLATALGDGQGIVITTHRSKFDAAKVAKELAALAQSVETFKHIGDALAQNEMGRDEVSKFFKEILDIPFEASKDETSTRKLNQFAALNQAYRTTVSERNGDRDNAFVALQAVTRWTDHDRGSDEEKRFVSSNFDGGNERIKAQAMQILLPRVRDKVLVSA